MIAESVEQLIELGGEALIFLLAINAGRVRGSHGQCRAHHLTGFFETQIAHELSEVRQPVCAGKQHVDRETDAQDLRDLAQARLQIARRVGDGFGCARAGERFEIEAQ